MMRVSVAERKWACKAPDRRRNSALLGGRRGAFRVRLEHRAIGEPACGLVGEHSGEDADSAIGDEVLCGAARIGAREDGYAAEHEDEDAERDQPAEEDPAVIGFGAGEL